MVFFGFWAFNTAGKTVTKVGIYALPPLGGPQKVTFLENYRFLLKFIVSTVQTLKVHEAILTHTVLLKCNIIEKI
jgi:hypothetical protein